MHIKKCCIYVVFFLLNIQLYATEYRSIIIINGSDSSESSQDTSDISFSGPGALVTTLALAIISESAPILINPVLFQEFIHAKLQGFKEQHDSKISDFINTMNTIKEQFKDNSTKINEKAAETVRRFSGFLSSYYTMLQIIFTSERWYLFDCAESGYLMLMPKKYLEAKLGQSSPALSSDQEASLGFPLHTFTQLALPTANTEYDTQDYLQNYTPKLTHHTFTIASLDKIFIKTPFNQENQEYHYCWNIAMFGHGETAPMKIVGLTPNVFQQYLAFFNKNLKINVLYYMTCFGGGESLIKPYTSFTGLANLNYTVVSGATTDAAVKSSIEYERIGQTTSYVLEHDILMQRHYLHFSDFFHALEQEISLETALSFITSFGLKNIPLIRFKGTEWFSPVTMQKKVFYITTINDLTHTIDTMPFTIDSSKKALVLFPEIIVTPIKLSTAHTIEIIFKSNETKQYIDLLSIDDLEKFLYPGLVDENIRFGSKRYIFIGTLSLAAQTPTGKPITIMHNGNNITHTFKKDSHVIFSNVIFEIPEKVISSMFDRTWVKIFLKINDNFVELSPPIPSAWIYVPHSPFGYFEPFTYDLEYIPTPRNETLENLFALFPSFKQKRDNIIQNAQKIRSALEKKKEIGK